jgi:ribosomal protein L22
MADADEPKTPRTRSRTAAKPAGDKAAAADKPARTRPAAKQADTAEAPAKAPRARAAAKQADDAAAAAKAPRARAAAKTTEAAPAKPRARAAASATAAAPTAETSSAAKPARSRGSAAKEPAKPAPAAQAPRRARPVGPVTVRAQARYVRSSARKARLVCDHIRGKSVPEARALLSFAPRGVAKDWAKLLDSAVANAENNHELVADELHVTVVYADEGPTLKRFTPRAMGRATPIHKRTSHLTIMLGNKE